MNFTIGQSRITRMTPRMNRITRTVEWNLSGMAVSKKEAGGLVLPAGLMTVSKVSRSLSDEQVVVHQPVVTHHRGGPGVLVLVVHGTGPEAQMRRPGGTPGGLGLNTRR